MHADINNNPITTLNVHESPTFPRGRVLQEIVVKEHDGDVIGTVRSLWICCGTDTMFLRGSVF